MQLHDITIYAVREADGTLVGFGFDPKPPLSEPDRSHTPIDRTDPGSDLLLIAYRSRAEAEAYTAGLEVSCSTLETAWLIRSLGPELHCVLVDFTDSPASSFYAEDMRAGIPIAPSLRTLASSHPGMTNQERAEHAGAAVAEYLSSKGEPHDQPAEDYEISDLICDLLHHGDRLGFHHQKLLDSALLHYAGEREDVLPASGRRA